MAKTRRRTGSVSGATKPSWIRDNEDQKEWKTKFLRILKETYADLDPAIGAILADERLAQVCATKIRGYVDKDCTNWWYRDIKARGASRKKQLEKAIAGLNIAVDLYSEAGDRAAAQELGARAIQLSTVLGRTKQAYATKTHGRDRDHSFLLNLQSFLKTELGQRVTYVTIASLVNAGYEADGDPPKEPKTEDQIQKNLTNFKRNNLFWHLYRSLD